MIVNAQDALVKRRGFPAATPVCYNHGMSFDIESIKKIASELGFAGVYALSPSPIPLWEDEAARKGTLSGLFSDPQKTYPWAESILLAVYAYRPFPVGEKIPSYYLAGNRGYFACRALARELVSRGLRAETALVPARALALLCGLGERCKSGLLSLPPFGTRVALYTLALEGIKPGLTPIARNGTGKQACPEGKQACPDGKQACPEGKQACPEGCRLCESVCPTGAISEGALDVTKCLRYHMDTASHPFYVLERQTTFLGCELCQAVCPKNEKLGTITPGDGETAAFELRRLILGDARDARALVGRNITGGGKLTAEAVAFAARGGLYKNEIEEALSSAFPAVRDTAKWALERYF